MALVTYTVKSGDNLTTIARHFGTTVRALQDANDIQNPNLIYTGQVLIIPQEVQTTALKIKVIDDSVRLRDAPDFGDNVIVLLPKDTLFNDACLEGDWWKVPYRGGTGYIHASMVETAITDAEHVIPENKIVYRSQWDVDANNRKNDCGQTCVAMLAGSRGVNVGINTLPHQCDSTGYSNGRDLVRNFEHLQLGAKVSYPGTSLAPPNSICLIWYGGLNRSSVQDKNFTGWHWVVFLREEGDQVVVHDPDFWGNRRAEGSEKHYSRAEWDAAFIPRGSHRVCVEMI